ncbi:hypothetical protein MPL3356_340205 [Mesorhizobium plurifarium]|uniref:Uncharacterized protein n=1 Tax=Mesorhizobium plurifarium TaxID=69974 RepID=A0A090DVX7_MESPL|nr:hypothetical protein MPL3356_340205 [Mesorhizobium plurifarium]
MRPGRAILQACQSFALIALNPFSNSPRADACGFGNGLRRLPAADLPYNSLSTARRQPGILMNVHPVPPRVTEASQSQLSRSGPDGQPTESSQLVLDRFPHMTFISAPDVLYGWLFRRNRCRIRCDLHSLSPPLAMHSRSPSNIRPGRGGVDREATRTRKKSIITLWRPTRRS